MTNSKKMHVRPVFIRVCLRVKLNSIVRGYSLAYVSL